ncbi:hypothetical protein SLE2022_251330 [Rubroshorea leprosula]
MTALAAPGLLLGSTPTLRFHRPVLPRKTVAAELGSVNSQFSGLKISHTLPHVASFKPISDSLIPALQTVGRRVCPFTGKKSNKANKVSFSNHKTKKLQFVNLQYKKIWWEAGKRYVKLRLSTKALKTIGKNGLDAVVKKAGIDL